VEEKSRAVTDVDIDVAQRSSEGGICACIRVHDAMSIPISPDHGASTRENACVVQLSSRSLKVKNLRAINRIYIGHKNWCNQNISPNEELSVHIEKFGFVGEFKEQRTDRGCAKDRSINK